MDFLVVVFLSVCVCVCVLCGCNEDLFFKEKFLLFLFPSSVSLLCSFKKSRLFCLCFDLIIFSRQTKEMNPH